MTSEIAVMNQRAIALAADSAVTLSDGGKIVVRNDQRKLFNLAEGVPVGVMVFGKAEVMGHPWEVLLEHHRKKRKSGTLRRVGDYAAAFTLMLDNLEEFFPRERQKDEYRWLLASVFRFVARLMHYLHQSGAKGPDEEILRQAVALVWRRYQFREDGSPRRDLGCFPPGTGETLAREQAGVIDEMIAYGFSAFVLDAATRQQLHDIAVWCVVKDLFLEDVTGLVFAGYGESEPYPAVVTYNASAVVGGIVKRAEADVTAIDGEMHSAITLFADSEATYAFLRGIELDLEARIYGTADALGRRLVDQLAEAFTGVDPAQRESVRRQFQTQFLPQYLQRFYGQISDYQQEAYIDPVLRVLEIATRKDLAEMAQEFVALNIFKKRIMAKNQTVGGAVDVAIISRDAGFAWWKKQGGRA
jgi:hypothetical protein